MVTCNYVFIWLILSWVISAQKDDSSYYSLLGVGLDASKDAIKRAYRSMILELHPDKFHGLNMTEEDEIAAKNKFIKVTEAYETLVDDEKRKQYDYSLSGVDYSFVEEPEPIDTFRKKPFKIFMQTKNSRMYFEASFPKPSIPDLIISLKVSYEDSLRVIDRIQKYFRRRICPHCKGVGGIPSTCDNCQGSGVHKRCSVGRSFESCVSSTCDACSGKGYQLSSKCPHCSSKGFIMEEDSVTVSIPVGTRSGCRIVIENAGHEGFDGARGNSVLEVQYIMPAGWTMDTETRDLTYTLTVGIDALLQGYSHKLALPTGEHFNVELSDNLGLMDFLGGIDVIASGYGGALDDNGNRGNLVVHINADWGDISSSGILGLMEKYGFNVSDPSILRALQAFNGGISDDNIADDVVLN